MIRTFLLPILLFFSLSALGQFQSPLGATWTYDYYPSPMESGYIQYTVDSVWIDGMGRRNLQFSSSYIYFDLDNPGDPPISGTESNVFRTQEDGAQVSYEFPIAFDQGGPFFDFDAMMFDTVTFGGVRGGGLSIICDTMNTLSVDLVDSAMWGGMWLKQFQIRHLTGPGEFYGGIMIERIGNLGGFLMPLYTRMPDCSWPPGIFKVGDLRCYEDSDLGNIIIKAGWTCDSLPAGIQNQAGVEKLTFYPNPSSEFINIEKWNAFSADSDLVVSTIDGKEILKMELNSNQGRLNISGLTQGIYILSVINEEGAQARGSFIKK